MSDMGKWLVILGLMITAAGIVITFAGKIPWLGRLPGDIFFRKGNITFYFPLATSIILSIIISLLLWFLRR